MSQTTSLRTAIFSTTTSTAIPTYVPQAPPANSVYAPQSSGFNPVAIIAVVAAVVLIVTSVPILAILMRRHARKNLTETTRNMTATPSHKDGWASLSSRSGSLRSIRDEESAKSIRVTKEVSVARPEGALIKGVEESGGWSRTEVRGGGDR